MTKLDGGHVWLVALAGAVMAADYAGNGSVWRSALCIAGAWLVTKATDARTHASLKAAGIDPIGTALPRQLDLGRFLRRHGGIIGLVALLAAVAGRLLVWLPVAR